ncbi:hypothetical protein FDG95_gp502 [Pectobacterium phage vB_PcaM_CBB]|uniref:Uncharacterized protein n=1 Tax=Pectobacterium phage vB_PcaM_CBB TaxID=2772511 RepID=A0A1L2CVH5_9CAUD|nr:hypothetical protein FDG95_gp502 [Pectobacterium phage vB_PcaM_CBB]AMM44040.1 hypothetical protein CBB_477 [Pectobacterium phage vB_PcaM_CBB]
MTFEMTVEQIPVSIGSSSLVGVSSEFPRGHGNYISTFKRSNVATTYEIVNLSYEDLVDAIHKGIIDTNTMEAEVYHISETMKVAFVIDKRFPPICLTPEWFYGNRSKVKVDIVRRKYNVPELVCSCEYEDSRNAAIMYNYFSYNIPDCIDMNGKCIECGTSYRLVRKKNYEA